jgi:hypothetical protein
MADEDFGEWARSALGTIINYDRGQSHIHGEHLSFATLCKNAGVDEVIAPSNRAVTAVQNAAYGASDNGLFELKAYYKRAIREADHFKHVPRHIRVAIEELYGPEASALLKPERFIVDAEPDVSQVEAENPFSLSYVFSMIRYKEPRDRALLGQYYSGIWDIIRYSAQTDEHARKGDPSVVRAAVEVMPIDKEHKEPWFRLLYRPSGEAVVRESTGSVILVNRGQYFCFFGHERDSDAPLFIVAKFVKGKEDSFHTLVVRRHNRGFVFASRAVFIRSKASDLDKLRNKIGVRRESEVLRSNDIRRIKHHLKSVQNEIDNYPKGVLTL